MTKITQDRLKEVLIYDLGTGRFIWRVKRSNVVRAGMLAGSVTVSGYITIQVDGHPYRASQLAHLWMTGRLADPYCDHENGDILDDRWGNLREASQPQNAKNRKVNVNNRIGIKGVCLFKGKFRAQIQVDGRKIHLGTFNTSQEAGIAYTYAAKKHHGQFSRKIG